MQLLWEPDQYRELLMDTVGEWKVDDEVLSITKETIELILSETMFTSEVKLSTSLLPFTTLALVWVVLDGF